jgi:PPOX class probable F420-dependent enzyme
VRTNLAIEDLGGLLDERRVAVLATYRRDGTVLLSPVWHEWHDEGFNVWVLAGNVKERHLRRDPRASILVAESDPPLRGIELRTIARLITDGAQETARRIAARYIGAAQGADYVASSGGHDVIVRLEPSDVADVRAWDFADDFGTT